MTPQDAVRTCWSKYADFTGRASRSEFWWWVLFHYVVLFGALLLGSAISDGVATVLWLIAALALVVPSIAVAVRRLHDRDMSGWWLLLNLIVFFGGLALLVILALEGTPGDNRFGPAPQHAPTPVPAPPAT